MKKILLPVVMLGALMPMIANATLLGRVNSYYGAKQTEAAIKAQTAYEDALTTLRKAKEALAKIDDGIADNATAVAKAKEEVSKYEKDALAKQLEAATARMVVQLTGPEDNASGIKEGIGPISVSSAAGKEISSVEFTAYQLNMLVAKAKCNKDGKKNHMLKFVSDETACEGKSTDGYYFTPVYFLLHKALNSNITNETLARDLLDNEHGGLINVKFTPSIYHFAVIGADKKELPTGTKVFLDFGAKYVEAPSAKDAKSSNYVGAGYLGVGVNFEFGLYASQDGLKDIAAGTIKPQGGMAIGFGYYKNWVNSGGFNNAEFSVPTNYKTYVLGYEFQVTNKVSIAGSRSIPTEHNSLGTYSSIAMKYAF